MLENLLHPLKNVSQFSYLIYFLIELKGTLEFVLISRGFNELFDEDFSPNDIRLCYEKLCEMLHLDLNHLVSLKDNFQKIVNTFPVFINPPVSNCLNCDKKIIFDQAQFHKSCTYYTEKIKKYRYL